jgi:hypothetical protein
VCVVVVVVVVAAVVVVAVVVMTYNTVAVPCFTGLRHIGIPISIDGCSPQNASEFIACL